MINGQWFIDSLNFVRETKPPEEVEIPVEKYKNVTKNPGFQGKRDIYVRYLSQIVTTLLCTLGILIQEYGCSPCFMIGEAQRERLALSVCAFLTSENISKLHKPFENQPAEAEKGS